MFQCKECDKEITVTQAMCFNCANNIIELGEVV